VPNRACRRDRMPILENDGEARSTPGPQTGQGGPLLTGNDQRSRTSTRTRTIGLALARPRICLASFMRPEGPAPKGLEDSAQGFNPGIQPIKRFALKGREERRLRHVTMTPCFRVVTTFDLPPAPSASPTRGTGCYSSNAHSCALSGRFAWGSVPRAETRLKPWVLQPLRGLS
jgi:hypothetical protein